MPSAFAELWEAWEEALAGVSIRGEVLDGGNSRGAGLLATEVAERARQEQFDFVQSLLSSAMPALGQKDGPESGGGRGGLDSSRERDGEEDGSGGVDGTIGTDAEEGQHQLGVEQGVSWEDLDEDEAMALVAAGHDVVSAIHNIGVISTPGPIFTPLLLIPANSNGGMNGSWCCNTGWGWHSL